jgi:hypothetical protein
VKLAVPVVGVAGAALPMPDVPEVVEVPDVATTAPEVLAPECLAPVAERRCRVLLVVWELLDP